MVRPKGIHDKKKDIVNFGLLPTGLNFRFFILARPQKAFFRHGIEGLLAREKGNNRVMVEIAEAGR